MLDARDGLAIALKKSGMKQVAVAERVGLTEQQMSDIICHRRKLDANEMFRLCDVLGVTPNDLFVSPKGTLGIAENDR